MSQEGKPVNDRELRESLESLAGYLVDRMETSWTRATIAIEFVADDVVKLSGEYTDQAGAAVALAFDQDVIAITDDIKHALGEPHREQVLGLHLTLGADGALSVEFTYANAE